MNLISQNAALLQEVGNREKKNSRRIVKMKYENNEQMVATMQNAVGKGITKIIITPRVDMAGCGYVWIGLRKGQTELQGKLLLNYQIWNYLLAFLLGEELPEINKYDADKEICCQGEWLEELDKEIRQHTSKRFEMFLETEDGTGYLSHKWYFPNGAVIMPAEIMDDITALFD